MPVLQKATQASILGEQGDYAASIDLGEQALVEQDQLAWDLSGITKNVIAYSLYGSEPLYGEGAVLNAQTVQALLPHWEMRVYHDSSVSAKLLERLQQAGAQTQLVDDLGIAHWPGTFWRFYAVQDPMVDRVLFRDADSQITLREKSLIDEWLTSAYPFHVMRDWYTHVELILAGLWGASAPLLAQMPQWIEHYVAHELEHNTHDDQLFLAKYVWPRIRRYTLVHDSMHAVLGAQPIKMPRERQELDAVLGGYGAVVYPVTLNPPLAQAHYTIRVSDAQTGDEICSYRRLAKDGRDAFRLPQYHYEQVTAGRWRLEVLS